MPTTLHTSDLPGLPLLHRGKVRDVYALPENRLLIVATDRLSAFDVVLPDPIPGKGEMLTRISNFWFARTAGLMPNHLTDVSLDAVLPAGVDRALYATRAIAAGETIAEADIIALRPAHGLTADRWRELIGTAARRAIGALTPFEPADLEVHDTPGAGDRRRA